MANTVYLVACSRGTCASTVPTKVLHKFVSSFKILFLCTSYKAMKNIWCHLVIFAVRVFHEQYGHRGGTSSVKWSPSGGFFATAGSDQMIKLWEVHSCKYYWDRLSQDSWSWLVVMLIRGGSEGCIRGAWTPFTWSENLFTTSTFTCHFHLHMSLLLSHVTPIVTCHFYCHMSRPLSHITHTVPCPSLIVTCTSLIVTFPAHCHI